ncbi:hypothetical protein [Clostridium sp.]|uniref:hypothetical protein n=1 Tax=Clostridium sp. TaxID=1506 RepID=UPI002FC9EEF2
MILTQQINFINQCTKDMDKFTLYLSVSDKKITCEPSLALKYYYKWSLKYIYKTNLEDISVFDYFTKIVSKEEYKALGKMEYTDVKNLVVAHYSLGELYFHDKKYDLCKEHFNKVISILEETLKSGNKYGHEVMREREDVSFFELMMWSGKNIADMESGEEALEKYEAVVSESDFFYLQKNYCIYNVSKSLNIVTKAHEAARNIIKVLPDYENVNIDVISFLKVHREYYSALEFIISEYRRTGDKQWIDMTKDICCRDSNFNIQCVEKVLCFCEILLWNLELAEWSSIILSLYNAINTWDTAIKHVLNYLRKSFNKINYEKDFSHFPQCVGILSKIYEHIRINKYESKELREYEFDFTIFLLEGAFYNKNYCEAFESATKLSFMTYRNNNIKDIKNKIDTFKVSSIEGLVLENDILEKYPWAYLKETLEYVRKQCETKELNNEEINPISSANDEKSEKGGLTRELNQYNIQELSIEDESYINIKDKFYSFNNKIDQDINSIIMKINEEESILSHELETLSDSIYENKDIEAEIETILKEFIAKIKGDLEFLREYGDSKIKIALPDILENNLNVIDEFNDVKTIKGFTEEKLKEIIAKWCEENLQSLLWEQFNVYLSKYTNLYLEHMEIINKVEGNRKRVQTVCEDFNTEINEISIIPKEEVYDKFMNHYKEFLSELSYDIRVLRDEKMVDTVAITMKSIFLKAENRLDNVKNRIRLQVSEEKSQIADRLIEEVFIDLKGLGEKLQTEVETLFSDILKEVIMDRSCIEKRYHIAKLNHSELKNRNEEIEILLNLIREELGKFDEQVSLGIIYFNNKCYRI